MIAVAAVVLASVIGGVAVERRRGRAARLGARRILDLMLYGLVPFATFFNIARLHVTTGVGGGIGLAYLELGLVGLLAWWIATRWLDLDRPATGALICAAVLANTGYLGLPLTLATLGEPALGPAIAFDTLVSAPMLLIVGFGLGAAFGSRAGETSRQRLRAFVSRNPPLLAVAAGLIAPAAVAPDALVHASRLVVLALLPMGFFVVGVNLSAEAEEGKLGLRPTVDRALGAALALRLVAAPALMLLFSWTLLTVPDAYLLQAAMPSAINTLLVAHAYGLDLRIAAGAIAWGTGLVIAVGLAVGLL